MSDDNGSEVKRNGSQMLRKASRKGASGEHPTMQAVRAKMDSIREGTLPELEALKDRIDKLKKKSDPPASSDIEEDDTLPGIVITKEGAV